MSIVVLLNHLAADYFCFQGYHFSGISRNLAMSGNSAKVRENSGKRHKVQERSGNLCSQGYLIVTPWQYAGNKTLMSDVQQFELTLVSC